MDKLKKILKWMGIALGALVVLISIGAGVASCMYSARADVRYETADHDFEIPDDPALAEEGERLFMARGCAECHGMDAAGKTVVDAPPFFMAPPNITGVMRTLEATDIHRLVRRGVRTDGSPVFFMPSHEYQRMPDRELGLITMHIRSLPQSDATHEPSEMRLLGRVLWAVGVLDLVDYPAEVIDQDAAFNPIREGNAEDLGAYIGASCSGCHGEHMSGGPIPAAPPELGIPANITPHETGLADWDLEEFRALIRTGTRPDGTEVNGVQMPWPVYQHMNDEEIDALWGYLGSLEPRDYGNR